MDYETFRTLASRVFPMTLLLKLATDPMAFYELLQGRDFARFMGAAYKADTLSEDSREVIGSVGGELNGALSQLKSLGIEELMEFCHRILHTPSAVSATNYLNDTLFKRITDLEEKNTSLTNERSLLNDKVAAQDSEIQRFDRDTAKLKRSYRGQILNLEGKVEDLARQLQSRRMILFPRVWSLIHGHMNSLPEVSGEVRLIGISPVSQFGDDELPDQLEGVAYLLRRDGTVCELSFAFSMRERLAEIREKVAEEQSDLRKTLRKKAQLSEKPDEKITPEGIVRNRYQGTVQRLIYKLYCKTGREREGLGWLVGFVAESMLPKPTEAISQPFRVTGGIRNLPFPLCAPDSIVLSGQVRFGIAVASLIGYPKITVFEAMRGGCLPKMFAASRVSVVELTSP